MSKSINRLEARVSQLLALSAELRKENETLRKERADLHRKNELAREKVESIITRLKQMDHGDNNV